MQKGLRLCKHLRSRLVAQSVHVAAFSNESDVAHKSNGRSHRSQRLEHILEKVAVSWPFQVNLLKHALIVEEIGEKKKLALSRMALVQLLNACLAMPCVKLWSRSGAQQLTRMWRIKWILGIAL